MWARFNLSNKLFLKFQLYCNAREIINFDCDAYSIHLLNAALNKKQNIYISHSIDMAGEFGTKNVFECVVKCFAMVQIIHSLTRLGKCSIHHIIYRNECIRITNYQPSNSIAFSMIIVVASSFSITFLSLGCST